MREQGPLFTCVWLRGRAEIILITKGKNCFNIFITEILGGMDYGTEMLWHVWLMVSWKDTTLPLSSRRISDQLEDRGDSDGCFCFKHLCLPALCGVESVTLQNRRQLKHRRKVPSLVCCVRWKVEGIWGDLGLRWTLVFAKRCAVIRRAPLCNRLNSERGAGGLAGVSESMYGGGGWGCAKREL